MVRIADVRQKEVINVKDGCRLGYVCDVTLDVDDGKITKLIVPGPGRLFGMFGSEQEFHIPWCDVKCIGDDIILVDVKTEEVLVDCE